MCVGLWLNRVYRGGTPAIVAPRYCRSISHSPHNNGIFPTHFPTVGGGENVSPIHPPDCPRMQKTLLALFCLAPSGKINNWKHYVLKTDLSLTSEHLSMYVSPPLPSPRSPLPPSLAPSWGLDWVFVQCRGLELRALVNAPWEKINFSWMSPWCFKRRAGAGGLVCPHQPINKRNTDVPQDWAKQIHEDAEFGSEMIFPLKLQGLSLRINGVVNKTFSESDMRQNKALSVYCF